MTDDRASTLGLSAMERAAMRQLADQGYTAGMIASLLKLPGDAVRIWMRKRAEEIAKLEAAARAVKERGKAPPKPAPEPEEPDDETPPPRMPRRVVGRRRLALDRLVSARERT